MSDISWSRCGVYWTNIPTPPFTTMTITLSNSSMRADRCSFESIQAIRGTLILTLKKWDTALEAQTLHVEKVPNMFGRMISIDTPSWLYEL
jgi:hypothetical protein